MKVVLNGTELTLRTLTDQEYNQVERLSRMSSVSMDVCPTCGARETEIPGSGGVKEFKTGSYRYRGLTYPCDCHAQMALRARYLLANIGDQYMRLDWKDFDGTEDAQYWVATYLQKWQSFKLNGMGLEFGGPDIGTGKTFAATTVGKELVKLGQRVYFIPFIEMVDAFQSDNGKEIERRMRETTFLILDEILPPVSERQRDFYETKLEALVRYRTNFNLPIISTTNLPEENLSVAYPRTYSLLQAKQIRVDMSGTDRRMGQIRLENIELAQHDEVRPIT